MSNPADARSRAATYITAMNNIRNRVTTTMVAMLFVSALLAPSVSEAAPVKPGRAPIVAGTASSGGSGAAARVVSIAPVCTPSPCQLAQPVPQEPPLLTYYVYLDQFHISRTRARHNDTDLVDLTAMQPPAQAQSVHWGPQDVNDGDHSVSIVLGPYSMVPDSNALLTFNYSIVNKGHGKAEQTFNDLANKGGEAAGAAVGAYLSGGLLGGAVGAGAGYLVGLLAGMVFPNCDGVVAADSVGPLTGAQLANLTTAGAYSETRHYPGTDSPVGSSTLAWGPESGTRVWCGPSSFVRSYNLWPSRVMTAAMPRART